MLELVESVIARLLCCRDCRSMVQCLCFVCYLCRDAIVSVVYFLCRNSAGRFADDLKLKAWGATGRRVFKAAFTNAVVHPFESTRAHESAGTWSLPPLS